MKTKNRHLGLIGSLMCFGVFSSSTVYTTGNSSLNYNLVDVTFITETGTFIDGSTVKVYSARKGVQWSKLVEGEEKPKISDIKGPDGSSFTGKWQFKILDDETGKVKEYQDVKDSYVVNESTTVYASFTSNDFETAPWSQIIGYFNNVGNSDENPLFKMGQDFGCKTKVEKNTYTLPELIGKEKTLKYAGKDRKVRLVGMGQDKIAGKDDRYWAGMTFEFVDCVDDSPFALESSSYKNNWSKSYLNKYLSNDAINNFDSEISDALVNITKKTFKGNGAESKTIESTNHKVFLPSAYELGITKSCHGTNLATESEGLLEPIEANWDIKYQYYGATNKSLAKKSSYWLRSPDNDSSSSSTYKTDNAYIINTSGNLSTHRINYTCGIAPMFCIGEINVNKENFQNCKWETINNVINAAISKGSKTRGLTELKTYFGVDTFVGLEKEILLKGETKKRVVRVIGENQDILTENTSKKAALTFEFKDVMGDLVQFDITDGAVPSKHEAKYYNNSVFRNTTASWKDKIEKDNNGATRINLKQVKKRTQRWEKTGWEKVDALDTHCHFDNKTTDDYVFPISFYEVGGNGSWKCVKPKGIFSLDETLNEVCATYKDEIVYTYYKDSNAERRQKKNSIGNNCRYRLRTPIGKQYSDSTWKCTACVTANGYFNDDTDHLNMIDYFSSNNNTDYSCCFCM